MIKCLVSPSSGENLPISRDTFAILTRVHAAGSLVTHVGSAAPYLPSRFMPLDNPKHRYG